MGFNEGTTSLINCITSFLKIKEKIAKMVALPHYQPIASSRKDLYDNSIKFRIYLESMIVDISERSGSFPLSTFYWPVF